MGGIDKIDRPVYSSFIDTDAGAKTMFSQTTNQMTGFGVETLHTQSQSKNSQNVTAAAMRELWTQYLLNGQNQLDKERDLRNPLQAEFNARKFFGHQLDDRSIYFKDDNAGHEVTHT